ncbi:programmed cell death 2, partial [Haematococcus lacustris]
MASDEELSDDEDVEAWLNPLKLPTKEQLMCKSTGKQLLFLLQLYAPLDDDHPNQTTAFHRAILLFVTPKGSAVCKPGGVRALRCQLPRRNALYPYHAPGDTDLLPPAVQLVVEAEERDSPEAEAAMSKLMMAYKDKVGQEGELSEEELPEEVLQQVEEAVPLEQRHFAMFQARMALAPDQVVRYCFQPGAHPLWPRPEPQPSTADIPACPLCGEPRQFEFQVLPQLLNHLGQDDLDEDALDWGTLAVYSCSASCSTEALEAQTGSAYAEEFVWAQPSA